MTLKDEHEATPPWDAASVNLISKEKASGVFAVMPDDVFAKDHVATTAGFVIGERSVLVVEAMLNGDLASNSSDLSAGRPRSRFASSSTRAITVTTPTGTTCFRTAAW